MTTDTKSKKWNDEVVATLLGVIGSERPVSAATVEAAAAKLEVTVRSVASKLRQLDIEVASMAKEKTPTFSVEETAKLADMVSDSPGAYTYKDLAEKMGGDFTAKQVQGKLLALELTSMVKPADKVEVARSYTDEEEAKFIAMANKGSFIEDIAAAMKKEVASVRGKALSLFRSGAIKEIPKQQVSHAKNVVDPVTALGDAIGTMTVAAIASATDKTERGIRTLLTRRGIKVADYDGAAKKAKAEAKTAAAAA